MMKFIVCVWLIFSSAVSFAHQFSTAQLSLVNSSDNSHQGFLGLSLSDLEIMFHLDSNKNGELTWGEVQQSVPVIHDYLKSNILVSGLESCLVNWRPDVMLMEVYGEVYLRLPVTVNCGSANLEKSIIINYTGFFESLTDHKLLVNWKINDFQFQGMIQGNEQQLFFNKLDTSSWDTAKFYFKQGIIHIWIGLDHILFILVLVLPFAIAFPFVAANGIKVGNTSPNQSKQAVFKSMVSLITLFTVAHSVTLTLTALGWITLPSQWIEAGIAASVLFAAVNVITRWVKNMGILTFLFGLLHGMGFAGALSELGIAEQFQVISVLSFNLGVEIGQVMILLLAFPLLVWARGKNKVSRIVVPVGALGVSAISCIWLLERTNIISV